jgi:dTDP-4-amino-4,6-dideoxygalactose transaminase
VAQKIRLMTNFGFAGYDNVIHIGTNGKMTEVCAAMGLTSLQSVEEFVAVNRRNHEAYRRHLAGIPGLALCTFDGDQHNNYQYVVVEYTPADAGPTRDEVVEALWAENVMARKYFWPGCHRMEPYRTLYPDDSKRLQHTDAIASRLLVLPTGTAMDLEGIERLCGILGLMVAKGPALRRALASRAGK